MKKSLYAFYLFLKKPTPLKQSKDKRRLMVDFLSLFSLDLIFTALLLSGFYLLLHFNVIKEYDGIDILKEYGILGAFFMACVFAPILEELVFRWHLKDLNGAVYFIFLSFAGLLISQIRGTLIQLGLLVAALAGAVLVIEFLKKKGKFYAIRLWKKKYPFLFYYTAIIFGLVHLGNYKTITVTDPSFVLYIASQTFGGLGLGYLRIKYGLKYSILFHACFNLLCVLLALLFP